MRLETEPCTRCGGTGHHSFYQMYGTTCFKCWGSGLQLTERGYKQKRVEQKFRERLAKDFKVGDVMQYEIVHPQSNSMSVGFQRITEIKNDPLNPGLLVLVGEKLSYHVAPEGVVTRGLTKEEKVVLRGLLDEVI